MGPKHVIAVSVETQEALILSHKFELNVWKPCVESIRNYKGNNLTRWNVGQQEQSLMRDLHTKYGAWQVLIIGFYCYEVNIILMLLKIIN